MSSPLISHLFIIGIGGALGAILRYLTTSAVSSLFTSENGILWGTFSVNAIGSLIIGISAAYFYKQGGEYQSLKLLINIGMLGGFTTFSTFSFENVELLQSGQYYTAGIYILGSIVICTTLCAIGFAFGKTIL